MERQVKKSREREGKANRGGEGERGSETESLGQTETDKVQVYRECVCVYIYTHSHRGRLSAEHTDPRGERQKRLLRRSD